MYGHQWHKSEDGILRRSSGNTRVWYLTQIRATEGLAMNFEGLVGPIFTDRTIVPKP